jgi:glucose dehydrogenase
MDSVSAAKQEGTALNRSRWSTGVAILTVVTAFGIAVGTASSNSWHSSHRAVSKAITPSPLWTRKQLNAPSADNWILHYGNLLGTRYSSLKQITTSNVSSLKQVWQISLGTCTASIIAGDPGRSSRADQ